MLSTNAFSFFGKRLMFSSLPPLLPLFYLQCRTPNIDEEDDSDSSSDEEPYSAPVVQRGMGKQLRPPPSAAE